jgi:hypothetical protein
VKVERFVTISVVADFLHQRPVSAVAGVFAVVAFNRYRPARVATSTALFRNVHAALGADYFCTSN